MVDWIRSSDEILAALLVLLLTPALRFLWLGASSAYRHFTEWRGRRVERCWVTLGPVVPPKRTGGRLPDEIPIRCLLVRYGTDSYIARLACDKERFEGRRRFEVSGHKLVLNRDTGFYSGSVRLKVHKRLGTQFKLFIETESMAMARLCAMRLRPFDNVVEASISHYGRKPKVWLLLKQFHKTRSLDDPQSGTWNNHYWPV